MSLAISSPRCTVTVRGVIHALLITLAAVFFVLHGVHLGADFPNHSPWMDWSKYTDEGWYGAAAVRHFQRGHWYVPGDFNPAAALPVWPLLEASVFYFTGVSAAAARALTVATFGLILVAVYLLIRRWDRLSSRPAGVERRTSLAPAIAVLLLAVSPFCYAFTRLAILEPMLILLTLLALLTASYLSPAGQGSGTSISRTGLSIVLGLFIPMMVLTKTTAIFLMPAIGWILWARSGYRLRPFLRLCILPGVVAASTWLAYYLIIVRPRFLLDYRYLFSANAYTGITAATALSVLSNTLSDGMWMGHLIFPLALLCILLTVLNPRLFRRNPLIPTLILWADGYAAFLAYHSNLQPRYYLVIAVPLTMLVPIIFENLWTAHDPHSPRHETHGQTHPIAATALIVALCATVIQDARQTLRFVRTPEYTFASAAQQIQQIITADHHLNPTHNPLVLSISGSNLSLMTGLPSICDDFGTLELPARVKAYQPGWFVTWNQVEDDKMDALAPLYRLQRVASFPVMDDPERNLLILYRLDPSVPNTPVKPHHRKPIPSLLRTRLGQQPSETQLEH